MATREAISGLAQAQGKLWGARARDWAEVQEPAQRALYAPVLDAAGVGEGTRLLDAGCGSGVAAAAAHGRGAAVAGIDAALPLIELARERLPGAEFRVGELEALPYEDSAFDVVTGFNSFQYAADPRAGAVRAVGAGGARGTRGPSGADSSRRARSHDELGVHRLHHGAAGT